MCSNFDGVLPTLFVDRWRVTCWPRPCARGPQRPTIISTSTRTTSFRCWSSRRTGGWACWTASRAGSPSPTSPSWEKERAWSESEPRHRLPSFKTKTKSSSFFALFCFVNVTQFHHLKESYNEKLTFSSIWSFFLHYWHVNWHTKSTRNANLCFSRWTDLICVTALKQAISICLIFPRKRGSWTLS